MAKGGKLGWRLAGSACLIVVAIVGCIAFVQRDLLWVHYRIREFVAGRELEADFVDWLDEHRMIALPLLSAHLSVPDSNVCERAGAVIRIVLERHSEPTDPNESHLGLATIARLHSQFARLFPSGRRETMRLAFLVLTDHLRTWSPNVPTVLETAGEVFAQALADEDLDVKEEALRRLSAVWSWKKVDGIASDLVDDWELNLYSAAVRMFDSDSPAIRAAAAAGVAGAPYREDDGRLIELLSDREPAVAKAALLSLAVGDESRLSGAQRNLLVRFVNDADREVRNAVDRILRNDQISDLRIRLFRLQHHPTASHRARAIELAVDLPASAGENFDPAPLLLELTRDPNAAVRLAAVKALSRLAGDAIFKKLRQLSAADPSTLVRRECQYLALRIHLTPIDR